jgi:DNA-binding NtrC family response regulator
VRIVAATNRDLLAPRDGVHFRADLYYRLNVLFIDLPPLRDRRSDIPALVDRFIRESGRDPAGYPVERRAIDQLEAWRWPGNVRELKHCVERTLIGRAPGPIDVFDLERTERACAAIAPTAGAICGTANGTANDTTSTRLIELLRMHGGRLGPVAAECGVSIRTVQRRMKGMELLLGNYRPATTSRG